MGLKVDNKSVVINEAEFDPSLALLFASSLKARAFPERSNAISLTDVGNRGRDGRQKTSRSNYDESKEDNPSHREESKKILTQCNNFYCKREPSCNQNIENKSHSQERKRKRKPSNDNLEDEYMQRLARQQEKELKKRKTEFEIQKQKSEVSQEDAENTRLDITQERKAQLSTANLVTALNHESKNHHMFDIELEKASRTVFLANVSTLAISSKLARKTFLTHMSSFFSDLPTPSEGTPPHKVNSLRFRSTAYTGSGLPKRAAFAKKELMTATTKSTNAYLVYSNAYAARAAVKRLNGTIVLDRHLRVDGVAHPVKIDHRRCVFVGNLGFVDDESLHGETDEMSRNRSKIPADIEEGLWRQFNKVGTVESVRVVRDQKTRVGKGFAYVQFTDPNSVEEALLFNGKKYPPMLPRSLRVMRAKPIGKTATALSDSLAKKIQGKPTKSVIFNPKVTSEQLSLRGRATKLLGQAGAAKLRTAKCDNAGNKFITSQVKTNIGLSKNLGLSSGDEMHNLSQNSILEGHRTNSNPTQPKKIKLGSKVKAHHNKKLTTRSSRRASEWRKHGVKKAVKKSKL